MRALAAAALIFLSATPAAVVAQTAPAAAPAAAGYSVEDTEIGTLLDDPAAKAVLEKRLPGFTANEQIDMARGMTLKAIQQYSPDKITDAALADIQTDFTKLPVKK